MREIKFRAWDKKNKSWVYSDHIEGMAWFWQLLEKFGVENFIITQYTRLKDKSGKEIYEGDVVKMKGIIAGHFEPMVGYVYYEPPSFVVIAIEPKDVAGKGRLLNDRNLNEIIGNTHENPGLIKEED